ncbi:MAG: flagellar basal body P-ring protein FlgI [Polyangiales bacterium]
MKTSWVRLLFVLALLGALASPRKASAARVEDLCDVSGVRSNQLIGYGLVVGLNNTGDTGQSRFTVQSTAAMLRRLGATVDQRAIQTRNAAAVMVIATLPPFASSGARIDVVVSSMGNARSLFGGTLLQTPLFAGDKKVYAVAQGPVVVGGYQFAGFTGSSFMRNHTTTGRVPEGALVERAVPSVNLGEGPMMLTLRDPSFVNANRIAGAINTALGAGTAQALDGGRVQVTGPKEYEKNPVGLLAAVSVVEVEPDTSGRVVIDERTGTVVVGGAVRVAEVAIAQGGLTVEIVEQQLVSQPSAFTFRGNATTAVVPKSEVKVDDRGDEQRPAIAHVKASASLKELVDALNAIGARPRDLIAIFQALKTAGAMQARIEVQ